MMTRIKEWSDVDSGSFGAEEKIKAKPKCSATRHLTYFEKQEKYSKVFFKAFEDFGWEAFWTRQNHCTSGKPKFKVSLDPSCQVPK